MSITSRQEADAEKLKCDRELAVFERFLAADPNFAGMQIQSYAHSGPNLPPDIVATSSDARIGVELVELMDSTNRIEPDAYLRELLEPVTSEEMPGWGILLWLYDKPREQWSRPMRRIIQDEFRKLLHRLISNPTLAIEIDKQTLKMEAPTLARFVWKVNARQLDDMAGELTTFRRSVLSPGFVEDAARLAVECIGKKVSKPGYASLKTDSNLDQLVLLVHYDGQGQKGIPFNWLTPEIKAKFMTSLLSGPFELAFVFEDVPIQRERFRKSYKIYP